MILLAMFLLLTLANEAPPTESPTTSGPMAVAITITAAHPVDK